MKTDQRGFTLIEVMVAIMLMAIVSLIAWRGLDSVSRADSHLQASTEQTEALLRTLNQLDRDLALRASVELRTPALNDDEQPDGLAAISVRSSDQHDFQLNVIRNAALPENGLQRVRWWLEGDTLYRATSAASDRYPLPAPKKAVAVLSGISELQVRLGKPDCFGQVGNRSFAIAVLTEVLIGRRDDLVSDLMIGWATDAGGSY